MTPSAIRQQARRRFIALAILLAGCGSALVIYATATPVPANPLGYDPEDTKQYLREMEVYGGTINVIASEFPSGLKASGMAGDSPSRSSV